MDIAINVKRRCNTASLHIYIACFIKDIVENVITRDGIARNLTRKMDIVTSYYELPRIC